MLAKTQEKNNGKKRNLELRLHRIKAENAMVVLLLLLRVFFEYAKSNVIKNR